MSTKIYQSYIDSAGITFVKHGRNEITTKKELEKYPIGSLIAYETRDGRYSKGGFLVEFFDDYFVFVMHDFSKQYKVRYKNILRMWAGDVNVVQKDIISFDNIDHKTNFPIEIKGKVVKYATNNNTRDRFMCTTKYKIMVQWFDMFFD